MRITDDTDGGLMAEMPDFMAGLAEFQAEVNRITGQAKKELRCPHGLTADELCDIYPPVEDYHAYQDDRAALRAELVTVKADLADKTAEVERLKSALARTQSRVEYWRDRHAQAVAQLNDR